MNSHLMHMHRATELLDTLEQVSPSLPPPKALSACELLLVATIKLLKQQHGDHNQGDDIEPMLDQVEVMLRKPS